MAKKKKKPTEEFLKDIQEVFDKHNWSGDPIGLIPATALESITCVPPTKPVTVIVMENGQLVKKTFCL